MGNCWILESYCSSVSGGKNNQLGSRHINRMLLQSRISNDSTYSTGQRNRCESSQDLQANDGGLSLDIGDLRVFTLAELKKSTKDFRANTLLGHGAFSKVYKGRLKDRKTSSCGDDNEGLLIAIKRLNIQSMQLEERQVQSDLKLLGGLGHPNVVKLLGYGRENRELFLIYEFMQKGSLDKHLFGRGSEVETLTWDTRLKVMIGAARGLAFLHSLETEIIFRHFKPSNILLDKMYNAKLSFDFNCVKFGPSSDRLAHLSSTQVDNGTHDDAYYAAPENIATGDASVKSDVYGFGIVLVEILSGKRIAETITKQCGQNQTLLLMDWLKSNVLSRSKFRSLLMDARLQGKYPSKLALLAAQLALNCVQTHPILRPSMQEVADTLQDIEAINCKGHLSHHNNTKHHAHFQATRV